MGCVMWGCNSSPLGRFSALKSVLVRIYLILILLLLETELGAVFTSLMGPAHTLHVHTEEKLLFRKLYSCQLLQRICSGLSVKFNSEFSLANICTSSAFPDTSGLPPSPPFTRCSASRKTAHWSLSPSRQKQEGQEKHIHTYIEKTFYKFILSAQLIREQKKGKFMLQNDSAKCIHNHIEMICSGP